MDPHRLGELRSLAYHQEVAARLDSTSRVRALDRARAAAERKGASSPLAARWVALLEGPEPELRRALTEDSEWARQLRSASPFAGFLSPQERWALWRRVREETSA